ncbi:MAG TPA: LysR family transcriptional regulator [Ruminococcus sp.]|nr:LysR family transcriptional regulator [Ruminococcus sp.]
MEIRVLKYFLAVAREQSFSKAAESLYLSQPTLSRQLKDLEEELGKPLFIRNTRSVTLTEEGMLLRKRAEEIIELTEMAEREVRQSDENISGDIYIGMGETDKVRFIAQTARKLQQTYPDICYHIFSGDGEDVAERLDRGLIDFGILFEPADISKYESIAIPTGDRWGVLMRKDSPLANKESISAKDLKNEPLIMSRQQNKNSMLLKWFSIPAETLNIVAEYNLVYNASILVDEGIGYALSLDKLINVSGESSLCFRPLAPPLEAKMHFVWKKYPVFTKAAEKFLEQFRTEL